MSAPVWGVLEAAWARSEIQRRLQQILEEEVGPTFSVGIATSVVQEVDPLSRYRNG